MNPTVEELERRLKEQARSFCEAHQREVDKVNALRIKHDQALRDVTEASELLTKAMCNQDPSRRQLMQVLERLQRVVRNK